MTCWSTEASLEIALRLVTKGCIVVSDRMLISTQTEPVEPLKISCAGAADALVPQAGHLKGEYLSPLHLMFIFNKLNLS